MNRLAQIKHKAVNREATYYRLWHQSALCCVFLSLTTNYLSVGSSAIKHAFGFCDLGERTVNLYVSRLQKYKSIRRHVPVKNRNAVDEVMAES